MMIESADYTCRFQTFFIRALDLLGRAFGQSFAS